MKPEINNPEEPPRRKRNFLSAGRVGFSAGIKEEPAKVPMGVKLFLHHLGGRGDEIIGSKISPQPVIFVKEPAVIPSISPIKVAVKKMDFLLRNPDLRVLPEDVRQPGRTTFLYPYSHKIRTFRPRKQNLSFFKSNLIISATSYPYFP